MWPSSAIAKFCFTGRKKSLPSPGDSLHLLGFSRAYAQTSPFGPSAAARYVTRPHQKRREGPIFAASYVHNGQSGRLGLLARNFGCSSSILWIHEVEEDFGADPCKHVSSYLNHAVSDVYVHKMSVCIEPPMVDILDKELLRKSRTKPFTEMQSLGVGLYRDKLRNCRCFSTGTMELGSLDDHLGGLGTLRCNLSAEKNLVTVSDEKLKLDDKLPISYSEQAAEWLQKVRRSRASQASCILYGGQPKLMQSSLVDGIWESNTFGTNRAKIGGAFGNHSLYASWPSSTGSFSTASEGLFFRRGLATQSDYDEEVDLETELSNASMSDSDEDITDRTAGKQPQQRLKSTSSTRPQQADEEDDDLDNDVLLVSSPLDAASENFIEGMSDQRRPLWKRLEEAVAGKKPFLLKDVFDAWTAEGNTLSRAEIIYTITILRKRRKYWRALEVSDWVMTRSPFELNDMDFGIRVQLIAKLQGAHKAADYFATIPKALQTSMVYSILLTAYVEHDKEKEAVSLLQKAEKLGLDHLTYMYNQLMYLYKKNGLMVGVAELLKTMEEKSIEPNILTYNMILDVRARKGDVEGMEKVWACIEEDKNVEPDAATYGVLAKGYLTAGLLEKAERAVKKVEHSPFRSKRLVNLMLLKLYGQLGKEDQLERVWGLVTEGPRIGSADYISMIRSLGKVGNSCRAEDIFEDMEEKLGTPTVHHYNALLSVYASLGRTQKGESLLKQMAKAKLYPNPGTYHELVCMYLKAGQEHKAMEVLSTAQKASLTSIRRRPMYITFQAVLDWCAEKGDVKRAEKLIKELKSAGYSCAYRTYIVLLKAYEKGGVSPYGFMDRLRADNIIPNQLIRMQLKLLDGT